jgi:hypothetical protein
LEKFFVACPAGDLFEPVVLVLEHDLAKFFFCLAMGSKISGDALMLQVS